MNNPLQVRGGKIVLKDHRTLADESKTLREQALISSEAQKVKMNGKTYEKVPIFKGYKLKEVKTNN